MTIHDWREIATEQKEKIKDLEAKLKQSEGEVLALMDALEYPLQFFQVLTEDHRLDGHEAEDGNEKDCNQCNSLKKMKKALTSPHAEAIERRIKAEANNILIEFDGVLQAAIGELLKTHHCKNCAGHGIIDAAEHSCNKCGGYGIDYSTDVGKVVKAAGELDTPDYELYEKAKLDGGEHNAKG